MCGVVEEIYQEGKLEGKQEMYAELLANGKTVEEIASFHNKSVEEIKAILQLEV